MASASDALIGLQLFAVKVFAREEFRRRPSKFRLFAENNRANKKTRLVRLIGLCNLSSVSQTVYKSDELKSVDTVQGNSIHFLSPRQCH